MSRCTTRILRTTSRQAGRPSASPCTSCQRNCDSRKGIATPAHTGDNAQQATAARLRNLPGEQCSPLLAPASSWHQQRADFCTPLPIAQQRSRQRRPSITLGSQKRDKFRPTDDVQVGVGASTARPVAASAATYLGVPIGTQDFKDAGPMAFRQTKTRRCM